MVPADREAPDAGLSETAPPRIGHEFSRIPIFSPGRGTIQTKLAITQPGDVYEQEADRIAEQVMRMAQPAAIGPAAEVAPRKCSACEDKADASGSSLSDEKKPQMQHLANGEGGAGEVASDFTRRLGAGAPLDAASRSYFEPRFGHDFGNVRIHSGPQAATAAASLQARAFTIGREVGFAAGAHDPASKSGKRLLAHELAHVVQQSGADRTHVGEGRGLSPGSYFHVRSGPPGIVYRAVPEPVSAKPAFELVGNEAGAAGARQAAARLEGLVSGTAVAPALATIPITDPEQKNIVIQHVLNSPAVLRATPSRARSGHCRSRSSTPG